MARQAKNLDDLDLDLDRADPKFAELRQQWSNLSSALARIRDEERKAEQALDDAKHKPNGHEQLPAQVAALIGEEATGREDVAIRLKEARRQRADHERALKVIEARVDRQRVEASKVICQRVAPTYRARARDVGLALVELGKAIEGLEQIKDKLNGADVRWASLGPLGLPQLGHPADGNSWLRILLKDFTDAGVIDVHKDMPKHWPAAQSASVSRW